MQLSWQPAFLQMVGLGKLQISDLFSLPRQLPLFKSCLMSPDTKLLLQICFHMLNIDGITLLVLISYPDRPISVSGK